MLSIILVCLGWIAGDESKAPADRPDRDAYEAARREAGRNAPAQIRMALWCEAHGMAAERMAHLAAAVLADPSNVLARGLMGLIADDGRWESPDEVGRRAAADGAFAARLAEYNGRRARMAHTAEAHWKMALWCEKAGLRPEATAHLTVVTRLAPGFEAAWKHLGFRKVDGAWITEAQLEARKAEARAQKQADAHWKPLLTRWRGWLRGRDPGRRKEAEEGLAGVNDPRAVPAVWSILAAGDAGLQATAVEVLGRIDASGASRALAMLAVFGRSDEVRRIAVAALRRRDPREVFGVLVALIRDPLRYEVRPGSRANVPGELFVEGREYNIRREYYIDERRYAGMTRFLPRLFDSSVPFDPFGLQGFRMTLPALVAATGPWTTVTAASVPAGHPQAAHAGPAVQRLVGGLAPDPNQMAINAGIMEMQAQAALRDLVIAQQMIAAEQIRELSRQELRPDAAAIDAYNAEARRVNELALPVLTALTGLDLGDSAEAWRAWWADQQGYTYARPDASARPTFTRLVQNPVGIPPPLHSCFGAGTTVQALEGPRAIESIRVGDRVLSQDTRTGRLAFTAVLAALHNKPAATLRIELEGQRIVATPIHRLWRTGQGWVMAGELKPGDRLRTLGGTTRVIAVQPDEVQPVYNLEVADGQSFFVGQPGILVHDNSLVMPVGHPFDRIAPPAEVSSGQPGRSRSMLGG